MTLARTSWMFVVASLSVAACSSSPGYDSTVHDAVPEAGPVPSIRITKPADGTVIVITDNPDLPISFVVDKFTLQGPGQCGSEAACGHVDALIDGTACNDTADMVAFNGQGSTSPVEVGFDYCPGGISTSGGPHTITLALHFDDATDSPVLDSIGRNIADSIMVMVDYRADAGVADGSSDAATSDAAATTDTAPPDAGQGDAGAEEGHDGARADAAVPDSAITEASPAQDGGAPDTSADAGSDRGSPSDVGVPGDAATESSPAEDSGQNTDGATSSDATTLDAGPG